MNGFFYSVCQQLIVYLIFRCLCGLNAVHGGLANFRLNRSVFFSSPVLYSLYQRVVLAGVKEISEPDVCAEFVQQHTKSVTTANIVGNQIRLAISNKTFGIIWNDFNKVACVVGFFCVLVNGYLATICD